MIIDFFILDPLNTCLSVEPTFNLARIFNLVKNQNASAQIAIDAVRIARRAEITEKMRVSLFPMIAISFICRSLIFPPPVVPRDDDLGMSTANFFRRRGVATSSEPTLPNSSSRDVCSPGEIVLGVDVPLQDPFTPTSCGSVIESGEHSCRHRPRTSPSCTCAQTMANRRHM